MSVHELPQQPPQPPTEQDLNIVVDILYTQSQGTHGLPTADAQAAAQACRKVADLLANLAPLVGDLERGDMPAAMQKIAVMGNPFGALPPESAA